MAQQGATIVRRRRVVVVRKPVEIRPPTTRFTHRRWQIVVTSCALVLIAAGGFLAHGSQSARELASARSDALAAAKIRVPVLLSYDYSSIDADLDVANGNTTGKFRQDYARLLRDKIAPYATQKQVTNAVVVTDASVLSSNRNDVVVRLSITQTTKAAGEEKPRRVSRSIHVTMSKTVQGWFVSRLVQA